MKEFILPNLGDGVASGDVLRVLVRPGDALAVDQPVLELETDKATLEVPSSVAGTVTEVRVKVGDKVQPGQAVLVVDETAGAARPEAGRDREAPAEAAAAEANARQAQGQADRAPDIEPARSVAEPVAGQQSAGRRSSVVEFQARPAAPAPAAAAPQAGAPATPPVPASPAVRRLAREIGVDIAQVPGSGPGGRILQDDVKAFARKVLASVGGTGQAAVAASGTAQPLPDFSRWGEVERKPMTGVRRKTAQHLAHAWQAIPHVTQFDRADITTLERLRKAHAAEVERAGGKLTMTAIAAYVVARALRRFPQFNTSVDAAAEAIVYKKYVHVGIAVDTEHGLLVPVVRDADRKNILELSVEIQQLAEKARARKLTLDEMAGGSMSITNLGGIGGTAFTPIVNWPEVAILGLSRGALEPVWVDGRVEPRLLLPLALSYDHRVIDGADAIRFLRWVVEALEQPFTLALRG